MGDLLEELKLFGCAAGGELRIEADDAYSRNGHLWLTRDPES